MIRPGGQHMPREKAGQRSANGDNQQEYGSRTDGNDFEPAVERWRHVSRDGDTPVSEIRL